MCSKPQKVVYIKHSFQGAGSIPIKAKGIVLLYVIHPITSKLLVDFFQYGKAIVPLSSVEEAED